MIAELGHFALALALPVGIVMSVLALLGAWQRNARLMAVAAPAAPAPFALVLFAGAGLVSLFVSNEF